MKFEYKNVAIWFLYGFKEYWDYESVKSYGRLNDEEYHKNMAKLGEDGWCLCAVHHDVYIFGRVKEEKVEYEPEKEEPKPGQEFLKWM